MNVDWVIPCRYIEVHDNLGTIIGAGIDTLWLEQLPAPIQIVLAVRVLAMAEELTGEEHPVTNRVRDPEGNVISEVSGGFGATAESARPEWLSGMILPVVVQFEAAVGGTYTMEFTIDASSASVPIHVVEGPPPGTAP